MSIKTKVWRWTEPYIRLAVAGLDISDRTVKYLAFDTNGEHLLLDVFGEFDIPEGLISNGEIKQEGALTEVFAAWRAHEKKPSSSAFFVVSLPEEKSFLRIIQLPKVREDEVKNAIRWEIEANIPLPIEDLIYDYEIIDSPEEHLDHVDAVVTAFPRAIVESYVRVLKNAGLSLRALELESQAIVRSSLPILRDTSVQIIVDIGRTRTSFIVCTGGAIVFTTTIELGGQLLEENLMKGLNITLEEAVDLKKNVGLDKHVKGGEIFSAFIPTVTVIADELRRVVEYYHTHSTHMHGMQKTISKVLLVGGDSNLYGLKTYLAGNLKVPVEEADPLSSVRTKLPAVVSLLKNESLSFATVIGLALREIR